MSRPLRTGAWAVVAIGVALPLVRRRLGLRPATVIAGSAAAPVALCVAAPRTPVRDVAVVCLQMWAYVAAYQMPNDDPGALQARVRIDYPVRVDRVLGAGTVPGLRLQRALARPGGLGPQDRVLSLVHWAWFTVPHGTAAFLLLRHPRRFPAGAARIYATFDVGCCLYWLVPTAPPWYAAQQGRIDAGDGPALRRLMVEYGQEVWRERWDALYAFLGGNPLAAMPSLHFGTSVTAAAVLAEIGPVHGFVGWAYALTLGFGLVYLGEHYVVDLLAGAALAEGVRRAAPVVAPAAGAGARLVEGLGALARG